MSAVPRHLLVHMSLPQPSFMLLTNGSPVIPGMKAPKFCNTTQQNSMFLAKHSLTNKGQLGPGWSAFIRPKRYTKAGVPSFSGTFE